MTIGNENNQGKCRHAMWLMLALKIGAILGATATVAAVVALKKKDNREKVKKMLTETKVKTVDFIGKVQQKLDEKEEAISEKLDVSKEKIEKAIDSTKDALG